MMISRVAITGGTHGNEANGVELARHLMRNPALVSRPSFETRVMLTNTASIEKNVRYVEEDLNRCFTCAALADPERQSIEAKRAREINAELGPKGGPGPQAVDLIIDLHNTTAATGVALLMAPDDELCHAIGVQLAAADPSVRICNWSKGTRRSDYALLPSIAPHGMTFEVGSAPWGCVDGALYETSLNLLLKALDCVHLHNLAIQSGSPHWEEVCTEIFAPIGSRDFPRYPDGALAAMIHPQLQGRDFKPLEKGDPIFLTHGLETVCFMEEHEQPLYPFFINEAAYYEKKIAFSLARKEERVVRIAKS